MREAYLDNSSTTKVCAPAAQRALRFMTEQYGNPSSLHSLGLAAEEEMNRARKAVADLLKCDKQEIIFTSGGTESNNIALLGAARAHHRRGKRIVASAVEHPSVKNTLQELARNGFDVVLIPVDRQGIADSAALEEAIDEHTILVSLMLCNNETGALQPVQTAARLIKRKQSPALLHCDAVQAFGKIPCNNIGADLISISGHKLHAPKGIGALYIKRGVRISPLTFGGGQERSMRPGTESVPLIAALGEAILQMGDYHQHYTHVQTLRDELAQSLTRLDPDRIIPHSGPASLPYIYNFSVLGIRSEVMLHHLASRGVYVSSGSACSQAKGSYVLEAQGASPGEIDSAIRVSFSYDNTLEDIHQLLNALEDGIHTLRKVKGR